MTSQYEEQSAETPPPRGGVPKIVWVIPASAVVIVALILVRLNYGPLWRPKASAGFQPRPAPPITLVDQHGKRHRSERYLGRRKLVVLFFDGDANPQDVLPLVMLRDNYPQFRAANAEIVGVSSAAPETTAGRGGGSIPFPLLADVDYAVHGQWGVALPESGPLHPTLFLVDVHGVIRRLHEFESPNAPLDLPTLLAELAELP